MKHPFADLIGLRFSHQAAGHSSCHLALTDHHMNPHHVAHGAVLYAMADTGMGSALYPTLAKGEICATIQISMTYFKAVTQGEVRCETKLVNRGKRVANLRSEVFCNDELVASADGNYAIFSPKAKSQE